jgi:flavin-dependent dehydrogenase
MDLLEQVGLVEAVQSQGYMEKHGAVFMRGKQTCNFDFANQFSLGWKYTYQVPRADFDKVLADAVSAQGVNILYGHGVSAVSFVNSHVEVTLDQPGGSQREVRARFVLDCSGYGRVLPRLLDLEAPSVLPVRESLFCHVTGDIRPPEREQGKVWICIHPQDAWIWIIPFSNGKTSVGVVAKPEFFESFPGDPETQLRAILMSDSNAAARLANIQLAFPPQRIKGFSCSVKRLFGPHYALTGNATEFLDPIFSSGVTLAMESSLRAAQLAARELRGEAVNWQVEYTDYVMQGVDTFRAYVLAWYESILPTILFNAGRSPEIMRQICSVLAGYVWDKSNPYVAQPDRALGLLSKIAANGARSTPN